MQSPIVTVTAGAGYGKTQAVYSFLQNYNAFTAWLQLSERDNMPDRFWENFIAAVGFISKDTARRVAEQGFPDTERDFGRYLTIPQGDIIPQARYVFVFDDFHLLKNGDVLRFVEHSIFTPFPNIVSIIISRSSPHINVSGPDSRRTGTQVTEKDLRFTEEETVEYFRIQGIKASRQTAAAVCRDTEGWAFAIHLSALFLKRFSASTPMPEDHKLPGMRSNIFRLLKTEVMDAVSPALQRFLIKLSLIDSLSRKLLEALNPGKDLIGEMERIGSFVRYDSYSDSYSIHHLFLEYLTGRQGELDAAEKQEFYRSAARWCRSNSRRIDALNYYEKAGDYDSIIDIIDRLPMILPDHTGLTLKELLNRAPESLYRDNPMLWALYCKIGISLGFFDESTKILRDHIKGLEESAPSLPQAAELRRRALLGSCLYLGFAGLITSTDTGDYRYVENLKRAALYSPLSGPEPGPPATVIMLGSYICRVRDPEAEKIIPYLNALEASVPHAARAFGGCMYGMADLAWGEYAYFRGDLSAAKTRLGEALRKAREKRQFEIENRSLFYLLRIAIHRGSGPEIEEALKGLDAQEEQEYYLNRSVHHDIIMGWYYTQTGEPEKIKAWLKSDFEDGELNNRGRGLEILVKAKYHLAKKNYPAALASLSGRKDLEGDLALGKLEALALEAVCRYALRDREGTLGCLRGIYQLEHRGGITMPLTELGRFARSLMDWALKQETEDLSREWLLERRRSASLYAKKLFSVTGARQENGQEGGTAGAPSLGGLSRREQEVLACLSRGLTRTEIAGTLSLSINTVKSVIRSIYNKLGAVNRSHAVQTAIAAGFLKKAQ
jgi:LuxR family maltose regulon positive regulatory protein